MYFKTGNTRSSLKNSKGTADFSRRVVPAALSLVLAVQCLTLGLPQAANIAWADDSAPNPLARGSMTVIAHAIKGNQTGPAAGAILGTAGIDPLSAPSPTPILDSLNNGSSGASVGSGILESSVTTAGTINGSAPTVAFVKPLGAAAIVTETVTDETGETKEGTVLVVDCDEKAAVQEETKYQNLETDEAKTHIKVGARFPIVVSSQLSSKTAKKGDPVEARLKYDLKIGDRVVARKGAEVHGHVSYSLKARPAMRALISSERWYRNNGCLGLAFDEVVNENGDHLPLVACPSQASRIVNNKNEGRVLGVNKDGVITGPWSQQLRDKAIRVGIHAALAPAGVFSFGAVPLAMGLYGAANPSFAFMKPVGNNVRHRRLKGFAWGFISGVPGGMIIEDSIVKGQESIVKPGDVFLAEFHQEFDGTPATFAQVQPDASLKVHAEVASDKTAND